MAAHLVACLAPGQCTGRVVVLVVGSHLNDDKGSGSSSAYLCQLAHVQCCRKLSSTIGRDSHWLLALCS